MPQPCLLDALRLIWIVDDQTARDTGRLEAALGAGVGSLWLRVPDASGRTLCALALDLVGRCRAAGAALLVGDRPDVALAVGADGVQLGGRALPPERVRPWFAGWIGVSCHAAGDLERARAAGADYAVLSPLHAVPGKGPPLGTARFAALCEQAGLPVVALGGIDPSNAAGAWHAGADGVAVLRALARCDDPAATVRALARPR